MAIADGHYVGPETGVCLSRGQELCFNLLRPYFLINRLSVDRMNYCANVKRACAVLLPALMTTVVLPAQAYVGQFLESFKAFPPRQKAASLSLDQVMESLTPEGAPPASESRMPQSAGATYYPC